MMMKPATRINEFCLDIVEFCENDPYLYKELLKERENFLSTAPEKYYKTLDEKNWAEQRFYDYFMFSRISQYYETTPLEVFLSKMLSRYNQQDQQIFLGFKGNIFSGFTITKVEVGSYFMAQDLATGKEYKVRENQATNRLKEGDYIVGRIVPYETDNALSNLNLSYPKESAYLLKRLWKSTPSDIAREFTPLIIEKEIFQKYYQSINKKEKNLQSLSPGDEFQGKSPQEIGHQEVGPQERELSQDLMNYVLSKIKPSEFPLQSELDKAIKICQDKWLHQPQVELNNKTPLEAILGERKKLSNPRKDFSLSVSITPINQKIEDQIDLSDIKRKNVPLVEDLETLVYFFRENQIKVTVKNKWIPFKHLKLIEEKFISPDKDSFNLLGKEEKRGEEPFKKYIYFIDLLSRAAKFIYTDKRGYVQVNVHHFQKFTQKSYGEKVFELLLTWIEKLNWKNLQIRDYIAIYAENFQKIFTDILYLFYKYKINEKIEIEKIVNQLYGSEIEKMQSPMEVMGHLMVNVELALLTYLKWLGVINAQKEILIPGTNLGMMKNFWVTPIGNKLINRLVRYYIRTGKIQY